MGVGAQKKTWCCLASAKRHVRIRGTCTNGSRVVDRCLNFTSPQLCQLERNSIIVVITQHRLSQSSPVVGLLWNEFSSVYVLNTLIVPTSFSNNLCLAPMPLSNFAAFTTPRPVPTTPDVRDRSSVPRCATVTAKTACSAMTRAAATE